MATSPGGKKKPMVYSALLSRVAVVFKERIVLQTLTKDALEYKECFTGKNAVVVLVINQ